MLVPEGENLGESGGRTVCLPLVTAGYRSPPVRGARLGHEIGARRGWPWSYTAAMASEPVESVHQGKHRELPVDVLLRRAKPLPPHDEMVIDDLTEEEGAAFLAALEE